MASAEERITIPETSEEGFQGLVKNGIKYAIESRREVDPKSLLIDGRNRIYLREQARQSLGRITEIFDQVFPLPENGSWSEEFHRLADIELGIAEEQPDRELVTDSGRA